MSKFTVKSPIKHNGKPRPNGSIIELDDSDAEWLVAAGVLEQAPDDAKVTPVKKTAAKKEGENDGDSSDPAE